MLDWVSLNIICGLRGEATQGVGVLLPLSRRTLLSRAVRGVVGASLAAGWPMRALLAQGRQADLPAGFHLLSTGTTNVLAVTDSTGIALVDGAPAGRAADLNAQLAALPAAGKVHTLFNTHWHPEQTGSNESLGQAGATIVAQENTKQWLTTDVTWPWNDETVAPLPKAGLPNKTFYEETELAVGGRAVRCGHLRDCPHTDGDMYVFFPEDNVLAVGDAITGAGWPAIDWWTGGWIGGLVGGLDMLFYVANEETRIVPTRGPVLTRSDLRKQYEMYAVIWERLVKTLYGGGGPKEALAAKPTQEFDAIMGPSDAFVERAFQSLWAYLSPDA
jgi:glyoxylase-like metal-dependent hydrolase (beta-lactamase superfamily II)